MKAYVLKKRKKNQEVEDGGAWKSRGRLGGSRKGGASPLLRRTQTPPPGILESFPVGGHATLLPGNKCASHGAPCFYFFPFLFHFVFGKKSLILNSPDAIFFDLFN